MDVSIGSASEQVRRCDDAFKLLDEAYQRLSTKPAATAVLCLAAGLHDMKHQLDDREWDLFKSSWMDHPIATLIHQDPFTSWSYRRPRGYPGDARLLDFIYGEDNIVDDLAHASDLGRQIYGLTSQSSACVAVRERRKILAKLADQIAAERQRNISILSIASGHLREAQWSRSLREGRIKRWVALDQDRESVAQVRTTFAGLAVDAFEGSVKGLLAGQYQLGHFDLIYTAGLYDYLPERAAMSLTKVAFRMLNPGGIFLFANFARGIHDDGYMETFMNWQLIFRDESEMAKISSELPHKEVASSEIFRDTGKSVIYALIKRN